MKIIVTVIEKITSEAHINIPDGLNESTIKQHIVDRYNSGSMLTEMNIYMDSYNQTLWKISPNQKQRLKTISPESTSTY